MTHKFVESPSSEYFDDYEFVVDGLTDYKKYFVSVNPSDTRHIFRLSHFGYTGSSLYKNILDDEFMNALSKASEYECPFNGYVHQSIMPIAIATSPEQARIYIKDRNDGRLPYYTDMACDPEWDRPSNIVDADEYLYSIRSTLLGPGYTESCYPDDGSSDRCVIGINLENGDTVLFAVLQWFNK